jgi:hypothetical protein
MVGPDERIGRGDELCGWVALNQSRGTDLRPIITVISAIRIYLTNKITSHTFV